MTNPHPNSPTYPPNGFHAFEVVIRHYDEPNSDVFFYINDRNYAGRLYRAKWFQVTDEFDASDVLIPHVSGWNGLHPPLDMIAPKPKTDDVGLLYLRAQWCDAVGVALNDGLDKYPQAAGIAPPFVADPPQEYVTVLTVSYYATVHDETQARQALQKQTDRKKWQLKVMKHSKVAKDSGVPTTRKYLDRSLAGALDSQGRFGKRLTVRRTQAAKNAVE